MTIAAYILLYTNTVLSILHVVTNAFELDMNASILNMTNLIYKYTNLRSKTNS